MKPVDLQLRSFFPSYYSKDLTYKDLVSPERLLMLKQCDCFTLPNADDCKKYIDAYFKSWNSVYPILSRSYFANRFSDLSLPPSLPLLLSILYVGSRILAKTPADFSEAESLNEKAKFVIRSNLEVHGTFRVLANMLLETPPSENISISSIENNLTFSIRLMMAYGMHKDNENNPALSSEEKGIWKRMYFTLVHKDRMMSLTFKKKKIFNWNTSSMRAMRQEDVEGVDPVWNGDTQKLLRMCQVGFFLEVLTDRVISFQNKNDLPFFKADQIKQDMNKLKRFIVTSECHFQQNTGNALEFIHIIWFHVLNIFFQRVYAVKQYVLVSELLKSESFEKQEFDQVNSIKTCWESAAESEYTICKFIGQHVLEFTDKLVCMQNVLFMVFVAVVNATPLIYWKSDESSEYMKVIDNAIAVLDKLEANTISLKSIRVSDYILKKIYPDKSKYIPYGRKLLNLNAVEKTLKEVHKNPNFSNDFLYSISPPLSTPLLQVEVTETTFVSKTQSHSLGTGETIIDKAHGSTPSNIPDLFEEELDGCMLLDASSIAVHATSPTSFEEIPTFDQPEYLSIFKFT
ncbi:unnamed protein product [Ambrosiozyma monospora]|uniref:Unnamed protein product n=1 Tax=Ambrosiozyma monospora TaxID=43982 RepID=A0ACB5SY50_AMBMO|nr:unnamed protein product [Ambrosiozyma monospora]